MIKDDDENDCKMLPQKYKQSKGGINKKKWVGYWADRFGKMFIHINKYSACVITCMNACVFLFTSGYKTEKERSSSNPERESDDNSTVFARCVTSPEGEPWCTVLQD